jgi:hypothetical protein
VTEQNNPAGPPAQEPPVQPSAQVPAQPAAAEPPAQPEPLAAPQDVSPQEPAAPEIPQQAFGEAPAPTPPGDATFGAAPGFPPAPAGETFGAAPAPEKKKSNVVKIVGVVGAIVLALCIAGGAFAVRNILNSDNAKQAQTGDCIGNVPEVAEGQNKEANDAKVVDCASSDALYKVEGRLEDKTEAQAKEDSVCAAFPKADSWYMAIPPGGKGYVLCLSSVK